MAKRIAAPPSTLAIEREGKVTTWTLYKRPIEGTRSEQEAYARGFRAYVEDFNQGIDRSSLPATMNYRKASDQAAYELGYHDAKTSGVISDGRTTTQAESHAARRHAVDGAATAGTKRRAAGQRSAARSRRRA